jgi:acetolactate synthase-1/2/3 large subunit
VFQDLDQLSIAGSICKGSLDVASVETAGQVLARAWSVAQAGVPGPVHVNLPVDVLSAMATGAGLSSSQPRPRLTVDERAAMVRMARRLEVARRPLVVARPSASRGTAGEALRSLAVRFGITPLVTESPRGLSDLKYAEIVRRLPEADCLLVIAPSDYAVTFLGGPFEESGADLLLVDAPNDPEPQRPPTVRVQAPPSLALPLLAQSVGGSSADSDWARALAERSPLPEAVDADGELHPLTVAAAVREALRPDDLLVLDGGEFCQWVRWGLRDVPNTLLWNGKLGAIGGSIPMALGSAASGVQGRVIVILGDGSAGYHLSEYETAARYGLPFVAVVGTDGRWSAEWHQQVTRFGPERTFETDLLAARYDLAAAGYGGVGAHVTDADELRRALNEFLDAGRPACINVRVLSLPSPAVVE